MGHERLGTLPKTMPWKTVVGQIASFSSSESSVAQITQQTLRNVRSRFDNIESDSGVLSWSSNGNGFKDVRAYEYQDDAGICEGH